jgi:hypothetical protein
LLGDGRGAGRGGGSSGGGSHVRPWPREGLRARGEGLQQQQPCEVLPHHHVAVSVSVSVSVCSNRQAVRGRQAGRQAGSEQQAVRGRQAGRQAGRPAGEEEQLQLQLQLQLALLTSLLVFLVHVSFMFNRCLKLDKTYPISLGRPAASSQQQQRLAPQQTSRRASEYEDKDAAEVIDTLARKLTKQWDINSPNRHGASCSMLDRSSTV